MPRTILPTTANSVEVDWTVVGSSGWESVLHGSADSTFVSSSTLAEKSTFTCGSGTIPLCGRVMAVSIHFRIRQTVPAAGSVVDILLVRNDVEIATAGSVALTTDQFVDGIIRLREDPISTARFTAPETTLLGAGLEITTAPSSGLVQVTQLWVEVEFVDSPIYYDPYDGNLPDAITGDLLWVKIGAQPTTLVSDFLNIADADSVDTAVFSRTETSLEAPHVTEIETRHTLNAIPISTDKFVYGIARTDRVRDVSVAVAILNSTLSLGLVGSTLDLDDPDSYLVTADATDLVGRDIHLRLRIDRDDDAMTRGKVQLFVDYGETPFLEAFYNTFPAIGTTTVSFGSGGSSPNSDNTDIDVDFFSWQDFNKRDNLFPRWKDFSLGGNIVVADTLDVDVVKPIVISPPGVTAGQSQSCCFLDINDDTEVCEISQLVSISSAVPTHKLDLDYKSSDANTRARVKLQRCSDFFYWDNGTSLWQSAASSITTAFSSTRTRASVMSSIDVPTAPDVLKVTVDYDPVGGPLGPREVRVYKVFLKEE